MASLDKFRLQQMKAIARQKSIKNSWPIFEPALRKILGPNPTAQDIFDLGDHLSDVFTSNAVSRTNTTVAQGGYAWECLVAWYLNLVMYGTNAVVVKPTSQFLPAPIKHATAVTISSTRTNTESDLVAFRVEPRSGGKSHDIRSLELALSTDANKTDVSVIQCKTNWNDNAQIPMLWGLIYDAKGTISIQNVSIGTNGLSPQSFRNFKYGFMTVPTSKGPFLPHTLAVLRVQALSGGNYWGHPTTKSVARSIKEFFTSNFASAFSSAGSVANQIQNVISESPEVLEAFLSLDFSRLEPL